MKKLISLIDNILKWAVIILMGTNVINVLWQVFTRFILNNPSSFTEELARYLLVWLGLLGAAYAFRLKMHIAIDILLIRMRTKLGLLVNLFLQVCIFGFALLVMVIGGLKLVGLTFTMGQISAALQIQIGYIYLVIPISGILIMVYSATFFYDYLRESAGKESLIVTQH